MAAQTDAPDDLIAELARLMAEDARGDSPARPADGAAPVRIPGGDTPPAPVPNFDFSALGEIKPSAPTAAPTPSSAAPAATVRVPGAEPVAPRTPMAPESFNFDFAADLAKKPAGPVSALPDARPTEPSFAPAPPQPQPAPEPLAPQPALDQGSLADLIAAELASEMLSADDVDADPIPVVTGPAAHEDNFKVAPVFGLGSPQPHSPSAAAVTIVEPEPVVAKTPASSSALEDIERLVGPALQVTPQPIPQPPEPAPAPVTTPSPALRSLATPTIPASRVEPPSTHVRPPAERGSVDDAILAAAAATGARVEWVNPQFDAAYEEDFAPVSRPRGRAKRFGVSRAVAGPLVAVALLLMAGVGLYWMLGQSAAPSGPAPLITADASPVKEVPEPVAAAPQQSVVFNEISGGNDGTDEQLVSRDQADEEAVTLATNTAQSTPNVIAGTENGGVDPNQDGLVNRKVRTVTVRPDGTIVSGDDSLAGASILPVDRPNVPAVPGADFSTPDLVANANAAAGATATTPAATATPAPTTAAVTPITPGATLPVFDATGAPIAGRTVATPMQRPANFSQAAASAIAAAAAAPSIAPAATGTTSADVAAAAPATGSAGAYVQLSSQRSEQAARESAQAIANRYGPLFGGANLEVQRVDLGERGIFYRVLVQAADRAGASNICTNLKAAGGDCFLL